MKQLSYALCKQLKDAGFPQEYRGGFYRTSEIKYEVEKIEPGEIIKIDNNVDVIYFPTLSELIEACKSDKGLIELIQIDTNLWSAALKPKSKPGDIPEWWAYKGSTPEEAVAKLLIHLIEYGLIKV